MQFVSSGGLSMGIEHTAEKEDDMLTPRRPEQGLHELPRSPRPRRGGLAENGARLLLPT